ncbi:hypothetical protein [Ammoniphilus sp. YIM 78166]|uniref:hypothetical protein n=1 Tax=Ammoniphilus sp. YIM 78166 TaxID=1644106 RepID=UPI00106FB75E|nr:hypothetical protein [Ammoniphilus sp. YIM 78166]
MNVHTYGRWERVWMYWRETAEFKLEPGWYTCIDDAPKDVQDGTRIIVMGNVRTDYERREGKWDKMQEITEEDCKMIYGEGI